MLEEKNGGGGGGVHMMKGVKNVYEKEAPVPKIGRMDGARGPGGRGPETNKSNKSNRPSGRELAIEKMAMEHTMSSAAPLEGSVRPMTAGAEYKKRPIFGGNNGALENSYVYKSGFKMPHKGGGEETHGKHIDLPRVGFAHR